MVGGMFLERGRKIGVLDDGVSSYEWQLFILSIGRKEVSVVKRGEKQVVASDTLLSPLCNKCEDLLPFQKELCGTGVVTAGAESDLLNEQARLHVASNIRR